MEDESEIDPLTLATSLWPDVAGWSYRHIYAVVLDQRSQPQTAPLISLFFLGGCFPPAEDDEANSVFLIHQGEQAVQI